MEKNLISRKGIAEKYDIDFTTITMVVQSGKITAEKLEKRHAMYDEQRIVDEMVKLFTRRAAWYRQHAEHWGAKADRIYDIYHGEEQGDGKLVQDS